MKTNSNNHKLAKASLGEELDALTSDEELRLLSIRHRALDAASAQNSSSAWEFLTKFSPSSWVIPAACSASFILALVGLGSLQPAEKNPDTIGMKLEGSAWLAETDAELLHLAEYELAFYEFASSEFESL